MARTQNLELRGRIWWAYRTVPPSLRRTLGKRTLRRSLATSDLVEAQRLRPLALADFAQQIEQARKTVSVVVDPIAERALAWRRFAASAVGPDGRPMPDEVKAAFVRERIDDLQRAYGPDEAARFEAMATQPRFTPLDQYLGEFQSTQLVTPKTKIEQRTALKRLIAWDSTLSLETLDRKIASRFTAEGLGYTTSPATKNKHISCLSSLWQYMLRKGYVAHNPWRGQSFPTKGKAGGVGRDTTERPFTDEEIATLLTGPAEPRLRDGMLIAALTGMRINEICMLRVEDCRDGALLIRQAKSDAGVRQVPIHPGLTAVVAARTAGKAPGAFIIHELGPVPEDRSGRPRAAPLSKQFTRYREQLGVKQDVEGRRRSLVNFHSFRRWFVTKAEQAGQPPWVIEAVVGHARTGMTLGVYSKGPSDAQLRACVEAVANPLDWPGNPIQPAHGTSV